MSAVTTDGTGAKLAIGTTLAAATQVAFESDTYTVVGQIGEIGEFGDSRGESAFTPVNDGRTVRRRGSKDGGILPLTYAHKASGDDGHDAIKTAFDASQEADELNFRVQLDDKVTAGGTPTTWYFRGRVMSRRVQNIASDNTVTVSAGIAINSAVVEVAAT